MPAERFQKLFQNKIVKIERITSRGYATPKGKWLRGRRNEWVMLVSGAAKLRFQGGLVMRLKAGSTVFIPAGKAHRVEWTRAGAKTVWLAVHF